MTGPLEALNRLERPVIVGISELGNNIMTVVLIVIALLILYAALELTPLGKAALIGWLILP